MSRVARLSISEVTSRNDQIPQYTPGCTVETVNGKRYRYVQVVDAVAPVVGGLVFRADDDTTGLLWKVTQDYSEALGDNINSICGIFTYAATTLYYTFIQVRGACDCAKTNTDVIGIGDLIIGTGVDTGLVGFVGAGTAAVASTKRVGFALAAAGNPTATVLVELEFD